MPEDRQRSGNGRQPRSTDLGSRLRLTPLAPSAFPAFSIVHHPYFEVVYGPVLGPTAVVTGRNLCRHLAAAKAPVTVPAVELALEVGLRSSHDEPLGRKCSLRHALDRLERNHVVSWLGDAELGVHMGVPPLGDHALSKLPETARECHTRFVEALHADQRTKRAMPTDRAPGDQIDGQSRSRHERC